MSLAIKGNKVWDVLFTIALDEACNREKRDRTRDRREGFYRERPT